MSSLKNSEPLPSGTGVASDATGQDAQVVDAAVIIKDEIKTPVDATDSTSQDAKDPKAKPQASAGLGNYFVSSSLQEPSSSDGDQATVVITLNSESSHMEPSSMPG